MHCDNPNAFVQQCSCSYPVHVRLADAIATTGSSSSHISWSSPGSVLQELAKENPGPHRGSVVWRDSGPEVILVTVSPRTADGSPGVSDGSPADSPTSVLPIGRTAESVSRSTYVQVCHTCRVASVEYVKFLKLSDVRNRGRSGMARLLTRRFRPRSCSEGAFSMVWAFVFCRWAHGLCLMEPSAQSSGFRCGIV